MDSTHHDSAENSGGFWHVFAQILGIGLAVFSLLAGAAFIYGGMQYSRVHGPQPAAATAARGTAGGRRCGRIRSRRDPPSPPAVKSSSSPAPTIPSPTTSRASPSKPGQKVKVTFNNQSVLPQPHNFILGKLGSKDRLIAAFTAMITDPNGMAKGYIPESPDIIVHTKLLNPGQSETLDFTAPAEKGDYPYLCSFPGHAILMNGVMKVE